MSSPHNKNAYSNITLIVETLIIAKMEIKYRTYCEEHLHFLPSIIFPTVQLKAHQTHTFLENSSRFPPISISLNPNA